MDGLEDALLFGVPLVLSASTLSAMHWYPWNRGVHELDRVSAYVMGTAVVVGYPVIAMFVARGLHMPKDELWWALLLLANTIVSGATVKAAYWIDSARAVGESEVRAHEHRT